MKWVDRISLDKEVRDYFRKFQYVKELYPDLPLIIVDDDVRYKNNMIDVLMRSYREHPDCISCMRADLIMLRPDGTPRTYKNWPIEYRGLLGVPSYQLVPTGIGGVLSYYDSIRPGGRAAILEKTKKDMFL